MEINDISTFLYNNEFRLGIYFIINYLYAVRIESLLHLPSELCICSCSDDLGGIEHKRKALNCEALDLYCTSLHTSYNDTFFPVFPRNCIIDLIWSLHISTSRQHSFSNFVWQFMSFA